MYPCCVTTDHFKDHKKIKRQQHTYRRTSIFYTIFWVLGSSKLIFPLKTQDSFYLLSQYFHYTFYRRESIKTVEFNGGRILFFRNFLVLSNKTSSQINYPISCSNQIFAKSNHVSCHHCRQEGRDVNYPTPLSLSLSHNTSERVH